MAAIARSTDPTTVYRCEAAKALADLGDPRGADLLAAIAADHTRTECVTAARILRELGDLRGLESLAAVALNTGLPTSRASRRPWH